MKLFMLRLWAPFLVLAWIPCCLLSQVQCVPVDRFSLDASAQILGIGWGTEDFGVYSLQSSSNLTDWVEMKTQGLLPFRVSTDFASRLDLEMGIPSGARNFFRVEKLPVLDLGTIRPEPGSIRVNDVNGAGRMVGNHSSGMGFTWAPGKKMVTFGQGSYAAAVNAAGTVLGSRHGVFFTWTESDGIREHELGGGVDINSRGDVVGYEVDPSLRPQWTKAFLWREGVGKTYLPHLDPATETTQPVALNDAGEVAGISLVDESYWKAFYWTESGGMIDIAKASSNVLDMNNVGQVIGQRTLSDGSLRGFVWSKKDGLLTLPPTASPLDINDRGEVVGTHAPEFQNVAFIWRRSQGIRTLQGIVEGPNGGSPSSAVRINERGQVVGNDEVVYPGVGGRFPRAVLWTSSGVMKPLTPLTFRSSGASVISDGGLVYGWSTDADDSKVHVVGWEMGREE